MAYYKFIGSTGDVIVYGEQDEMSVHYACTCLPNVKRDTWSRINNIRTRGFHLLPSQSITEAEYLAHVKFALKLATKRIKGTPYPMRPSTKSGEVFDYSNFFETTTEKWKKEVDSSIILGVYTGQLKTLPPIIAVFSDPCLNLLACYFSKMAKTNKDGQAYFAANPHFTLHDVANIPLNELQKVRNCGTLRISEIIECLIGFGFVHDKPTVTEPNLVTQNQSV